MAVPTAFDPISPGETDIFAFDFSEEIGATATIASAVWACEVASTSPIADPDPASRLLGSPGVEGGKTAIKAGNFLVGCVYNLSATVTLTDGRVLIQSADLECRPEQRVLVPTVPGVAGFNVVQFMRQYPEFSSYDDEALQGFFTQATTIWRNDGSGPVADAAAQQQILYLLTAHFAKLFGPAALGGGFGGLVGRISSASQGPISVSTDGFPSGSYLQAWLSQTQYGAAAWLLMKPFLSFQWRPGPRRPVGVVYGGRGWF